MVAKKRAHRRRRKQKWRAWGKRPSAEEVMQDRETEKLFPEMHRELQKAVRIKEDCDITGEIIKEQYRKSRQEEGYLAKIRYIPMTLLSVFLVFIACLLLLYLCRSYFGFIWFTTSALVIGGAAGLVLFLLCEGLIFYFYGIFEKED